jgi:hypothetical protein
VERRVCPLKQKERSRAMKRLWSADLLKTLESPFDLLKTFESACVLHSDKIKYSDRSHLTETEARQKLCNNFIIFWEIHFLWYDTWKNVPTVIVLTSVLMDVSSPLKAGKSENWEDILFTTIREDAYARFKSKRRQLIWFPAIDAPWPTHRLQWFARFQRQSLHLR